jgi:alginate O-acetyltransferase complex protein AlgI
MAFNSSLFACLFLPFVVIGNLIIPKFAANIFLLFSSIVFYAWGEPKFVFVILASALIDYAIAYSLIRENPSKSRLLLAFGVTANIALLVYCKYLGFFVSSLGILIGDLRIPFPQMVLPLGISFVVFEKITYLVDVYRGITKPAKNIWHYLFFVFFFPKMLAGPIIKYHEISGQIESRQITAIDLELGATRFIVGLAKKVLVADVLASIVDTVYKGPMPSVGFSDAWLAAICFTIQIYFDFSGYSDMAIGIARMFGINLRENFNQPYLAVGFTEFWQRWHISLSTWIRDYLYIPLGGNRKPPTRVYVNLWICFLLSGLWHGASWKFVSWGAYHGFFVSADHLILSRVWPRLSRVFGVAITFILVVAGWVIFRAETLAQALDMLVIMANPTRTSQMPWLWVTFDIWLLIAVGAVVSFMPLPVVRNAYDRMPQTGAALIQHGAVLFLAIWSLGRVFTATFTPFLYFRF